MRIVEDTQFKLGQVPIEEMTFHPQDRDDIPAALKGLQHLYCDPTARQKIFEILEKQLLPNIDLQRGRLGMALWRVFVLGVLKQALNCDFDRLRSLAANHLEVRQMLGHTNFWDEPVYQLQTVIDNVSLLTADILKQINDAVVACGHRLVEQEPEEPLLGRVDSAVAKANVEWPTDVRLLWESMRCLIRELHCACEAHSLAGWRKAVYWSRTLKKAFNRVRTHRQWRDESKVKKYVKMCRVLIERAESSVSVLKEKDADLEEVLRYLADAQRQIDQVDRRLLKGEVIPHDEKVFSIHEPHTRWITKGKAGVIAELGLPVCVLEDQHQLILWHHLLHEGVDSDMIVGFMKEAKDRYPAITSCSMDKGYSSVKNRKALEQVLDTVIMPKRGKLSKADKERESDPKFVEGRRQHPAVESAINNLNHRGLGLIRTRGKEGFVRTVALVVVAANVHRIGQIVKRSEERRRRCEQARKRAA